MEIIFQDKMSTQKIIQDFTRDLKSIYHSVLREEITEILVYQVSIKDVSIII